jgi:hypothetical protein
MKKPSDSVEPVSSDVSRSSYPKDWLPQFWLRHPGFASIADAAGRICTWQDWPEPDAYYTALSAAAPMRFVGEDVLAYEDHVAATGEVPTRYASWHDLLNALIWHHYPTSKTTLNRLHLAAKQTQKEGSQRGRRRDAATLFDENGAIVWTDDAQLLALIRAKNWPALFLQHRSAFGRNLHVRLFGHGLLDQLRQPFLGLTAHALLLHVPNATLSEPDVDVLLASQIDAGMAHWTPADLAPLPILGIPDWWPDNAQPSFYDNSQYFRRERRRQSKQYGEGESPSLT